MLKLLQSNLLKLFTLALLLLSVNVTWGQYSGTGTFTKISSLAELTDGYYVIAYGTTFAMNNSNTSSNTYFGSTAISPASGTITNPAAAIVWKITTDGGGKTIYNEASATYVSYSGSSNSANAATTVASDATRWTFAYTSSLFVVSNLAATTRMLQYNASNPRFAAYLSTSSQSNLTFYKMPVVTAALTPSSTALTGFTYNQGSGPSTSQTVNLTGSNLTAGGGNITITGSTNYEVSSNNTAFGSTATIAYTGTSLASTPFYVRLKAGLAAGSYNSESIAISGGGATSSVSASGTVASTSPTISASGTLSAVNTTYGTASATPATFTASGTNLTAAIVITAPAGYEISTASGSGYNTSLSLTPTSGTVTTTTIYVRLAATTAVGSYTGNISLTSTNATTANVATVSSSVSAKALTIINLTGNNKEYDGLTTATVTGTATLSGIVNNDAITLGGTPAFAFTLKAIGTGKAITASGYTISGTNAANYTLTQPAGLTGNITAKAVTITGATAANKTYDGTTAATVSGGTVTGAINNDAVSVSTAGTFAQTTVGTGIGVSVSLTGTDAGNYTYTQPGITANITKATPVFTTNAISVGINSTASVPGAYITSTSDGAFTYSIANTAIASLSGTTITGVAAGTTSLTVNQAASTNYNAGSTTVTVNVTTITYVNGDFRTKTGGGGTWTNGSTLGTATWQKYSATQGWQDVTTEPSGTAGTYTVYITENVTIPTNATQNATAKIYVTNNATLTFSPSSTWTFRNIIIDSGATMDMTTRLTMNTSGNFEIYDNGNFVYRYTANPGAESTSNFWAGIEVFHPNSNFYVRAHDTGSGNYFLPPDTNISSNTYNGVTAYFGNLIIDSPTEVRMTTTNFTGKTLTHGNLEFKPVATYTMLYGSVTWTIGGNLIISQNSASTTGVNLTTNTTGTTTIVFNVKGSFINNSKNLFRLINNTGGSATMNVDGDITLSDEGKLDLSGNGPATVNLKGDLSVAAGALLETTNTSAVTALNFTGTGNGLTAATTQVVDIATTAAAKNQYINFNAKSGSYVQLASQDFVIGTGGKFTTESGSTLDLQGYAVSGNNFAANSGATLATSNTAGLSAGITTTTKAFAAGTNYIFNAATTSPFFTEAQLATFNNPGTITTNANVTLNRALTPQGNLVVNSGTFNLDALLINRNASGGSLSIANGATLKIGGTNTFPTNYSTLTFSTGSTVEYGGDAQTVNNLSAEYKNVTLSGTGAKTFVSGTVVGNNLTLQSGPTVTLPANTTITVGNSLINNSTAESFVVQDNAALLQTGTGTNTGSITVYKINNPLYRLDYTIWSSPVENQLLRTFSPVTSSNRFYEYKYAVNSSNQWIEGYWPLNPDATTFSPAKGYLIRMPNSNAATGYADGSAAITFTGHFEGKPNTGTYSVTLSTQNNRFNAVGNPYASPISVNEFFVQNSAVLDQAGAIYMWRKRNDANLNSSYAKLTLAGYTANLASGTNGSTGGQDQASYFTEDKYSYRLAPGQGFIVQTKSGAATDQLIFNNSMRKAAATTGGQAFLKSAQSTTSRIWVNLAGTNGGFSQSAIAYIADATLGLDYGYDGKQLTEEGTVSFYSLAENTALAIQARPSFETSDVVPMGYVANAAGEFKISIDHTDGLFATGQNVYLKDKAMGIIRNLSEADYTFTTEEGTFEDRFEIVYTTTALGTENPVLTPDHVIVYKDSQSININAGETLINSVTVFDIRGRKLYSQDGINAATATVNGLTAQNEVLIVTVGTDKGTVSKKIIF